MPELPEVETVKNSIAKFIGNAEILWLPSVTASFMKTIPEDFTASVCGARISSYRQGKYIVIELDSGRSIIWHLGMSGRIKTAELRTKRTKTRPCADQDFGRVVDFSRSAPFRHSDRLSNRPVGRTSLFCKMGPDPLTRF